MHQRIISALERALLGPDNAREAPVAGQADVHTDGPLATPPASPTEKVPTTAAKEVLQRKIALLQQKDTRYPSVVQPRALAGLAALGVAVACMFASYAILNTSNGKAVADWPVAPTVYLAAITALANSAIVLGHMEAVPVCWWYSASRGRTLRSLERQWQVSRGLVQAIRHSRDLSLLNLACIVAALVVVDGPFLQRASTIRQASIPSSAAVQIRLPPELPTGFSGGYASNKVWYTTSFQEVAHEYLSKDSPISAESLDLRGCGVSCKATVFAPGFKITDCGSRTWPVSHSMISGDSSSNATWGPPDAGLGQELPAFYIWVLPVAQELAKGEAATIEVGRLQVPHGSGEFRQDICTARPGIGSYDIWVESNSLHILRTPTARDFVALANNTDVSARGSIFHWHGGHGSKGATVSRTATVDGITVDTYFKFATSLQMLYNKGYQRWVVNTFTGDAASSQFQRDSPEPSFDDPTPNILKFMNEYMFRCAVKAATWSNITNLVDPGVSVEQSVIAQVVQLVFESDFRWFAGAAILELGAVLLILPMFWGFWKLSTNASLSPLSIALAFDAPLFKDVNSQGGGKAVVQGLGNVRVRFGHVLDEDHPKEGRADADSEGRLQGRIGIDKAENVSTPRDGMTCRR